MKKHNLLLLKNINKDNQHTIDVYEKNDGYQAIKKAFKFKQPDLIEEVKNSGLRGRGGAAFPAGVKWGFLAKNDLPIYLINNADESEPGTFKDRLLLEKDPHQVLEGMMIASYATNAHWACIYIRGEYSFAFSRIQKAIDECYQKGYLGKNIFGSKFDLDIVIHRGAGAYICGEETALLNSLEGKKGQPRLKPPFFPGAIGLYNCPTVVNNVETLSSLVHVVNLTAAEYAKIGTEKSTGTKLISVSGHINKPGVYEVDMGYPVLDFINNECGGIKDGKKLKAIIPGGSSMPILKAKELKGVCLDYESMREAGSMLGSAGFMVFDEDTDMVDLAHNIAQFYAHESCGQCTPCREGGNWIQKIFNRFNSGLGRDQDLDLAYNIADNVEGHTICAFGEALAWPAKAFIEKFPEEFKAKIDLEKINQIKSLNVIN